MILEEYRERIIQRERADMLATIAELEAELKRLLDSKEGAYYVRLADAIQRAEKAEADLNLTALLRSEDEHLKTQVKLAALSVCGTHCPACVEFTSTFQLPKVEYLGCLRKQSDSTKLLNQTAAPIGQPCPYTS